MKFRSLGSRRSFSCTPVSSGVATVHLGADGAYPDPVRRYHKLWREELTFANLGSLVSAQNPEAEAEERSLRLPCRAGG
jgi:hypothetical protein